MKHNFQVFDGVRASPGFKQAEAREHKRAVHFPSENIAVTLFFGEASEKCTLVDISPFGLGLVCEHAIVSSELTVGDAVEVQFAGVACAKAPAIVSSIERWVEGTSVQFRVGVEFAALPIVESIEAAFEIPQRFQPTATLNNLFLFKDVSYLFVEKASGRSVTFVTSIRNNHIFPGLISEIDLVMGHLGTYKAKIKV